MPRANITELMDNVDAELLDLIQHRFPLDARPFARLGQRLGIAEEDVIARLQGMTAVGIIRSICAVFEPRQIGYVSVLVAMKVPAARLEEVAALVSACPEVTHNYGRDHAYNLWFTLIAPSEEDVHRILAELRARTGIEDVHALPALRLLKINVNFRFAGGGEREDEG